MINYPTNSAADWAHEQVCFGPRRTKPLERSTSASGRRAGLPSVLGHERIWPKILLTCVIRYRLLEVNKNAQGAGHR